MTILTRLLACCFLLISIVANVEAKNDTAELKQEIEALKQGQEQIQKDLE